MTELLTAKLNRPRLAGAMIERPRLYAQLDRWCAVRAVVIHAPAGFGKSSLVNRWLETAGLVARTAWLNLDEDDADPARFVEAVAATLEPLYPGVLAQVRPILADMQGGPARAWRRLLSAIQAGSAKAAAADASEDGAASSHDDVLLVLDDLHRAQSDAVDELLLILLESGPSSLHLILLTRRRGSLRLARFHAHGELITLAADDLRFTGDEVADFLAAKGFATATDQELATVTARSEGWVTALQLATLSLRRPGDMRALLDALHGDR
ncbi:MAG: AAA family ATPase, partial [Caldilineaceae bacterium]|nr:AAA family ATPase [Caldilineaceae bacterium]